MPLYFFPDTEANSTLHDGLGEPSSTLVFSQRGEFAAFNEASQFVRACGFSVGAMQANWPCGIRFGRVLIAKWSGLSIPDRRALHGLITGDLRSGPVKVMLLASAPAEAHAAFAAVPADA